MACSNKLHINALLFSEIHPVASGLPKSLFEVLFPTVFLFLFLVKAVGFRREKAIQALVSYSKNYRKGTSMETVSVLRGRSDDCSAGLWQKLLPPPLRRGKVYAPGTPPIDSFFHFRPAAVQCRDGGRDHRVDRGFTVGEEVRKGGEDWFGAEPGLVHRWLTGALRKENRPSRSLSSCPNLLVRLSAIRHQVGRGVTPGRVVQPTASATEETYWLFGNPDWPLVSASAEGCFYHFPDLFRPFRACSSGFLLTYNSEFQRPRAFTKKKRAILSGRWFPLPPSFLTIGSWITPAHGGKC